MNDILLIIQIIMNDMKKMLKSQNYNDFNHFAINTLDQIPKWQYSNSLEWTGTIHSIVIPVDASHLIKTIAMHQYCRYQTCHNQPIKTVYMNCITRILTLTCTLGQWKFQ